MDDYDVRERNYYSLPIVISGAALVAVLAAIVTAVIVVSQSSATVVHRKTVMAVPPASSTALPPPISPVAPTPEPEGAQFFGEIPPTPQLGQLLPSWLSPQP